MATLFILPNLRLGGAEKVTIQLAQALVSLHQEVGIALLSVEGELVSLVPKTIPIYSLKCTRILKLLKALPDFLASNEQYTTIVSCCWTITVFSAIALQFNRSKKIICWQHGFPSIRSNPKNLFYYCFVPLIYYRVHSVIVVSQRVENLLSALLPFKRSNIRVVPNPIFLSDYTSSRVNLEYCIPTIVWCGRFEAEKDPLFMIHAFHEIAEANPLYNLVMLGDGTLMQLAFQYAKSQPFAHRISFPGYVTDPFTYYLRSSILALTSRTEGQPSVIPEALSAGLKVVSTPCSDQIDTMLRDDPYSLVSPTRCISDFANTLRLVIAMGPRSQLQSNLLSIYNPSHVAEIWLTLLS